MKHIVHRYLTNSKTSGFTLIEIILVLAIVGVIATVGTVGWANVTVSSTNNVRANEISQWKSTFDLYKSRFFSYPAVPVNDTTPKLVCLGTFTDSGNKCGNYTSSSPSAYINATGSDTVTMLREVEKVGKVPTNTAPSVGGVVKGPYAYITQTTNSGTVNVTVKYIGIFEGTSCPSGLTNDSSNSPSSTILSGMNGKAIACATTDSVAIGSTPSPATPSPSVSPSTSPTVSPTVSPSTSPTVSPTPPSSTPPIQPSTSGPGLATNDCSNGWRGADWVNGSDSVKADGSPACYALCEPSGTYVTIWKNADRNKSTARVMGCLFMDGAKYSTGQYHSDTIVTATCDGIAPYNWIGRSPGYENCNFTPPVQPCSDPNAERGGDGKCRCDRSKNGWYYAIVGPSGRCEINKCNLDSNQWSVDGNLVCGSVGYTPRGHLDGLCTDGLAGALCRSNDSSSHTWAKAFDKNHKDHEVKFIYFWDSNKIISS